MKICFVANFESTWLYISISRILHSKYNIQCVWIVVNSRIKQKMIYEEGILEHDILFLPTNMQNEGEILNFDIKYNELVSADRYLKYDPRMGIKYLKMVVGRTSKFLELNNVSLIIGELTWAHERAIRRMVLMSSRLNVTYVNPHTVRIPSERFAFFESESNNFDNMNYNVQNTDNDNGNIELVKPSYFHSNNKLLEDSKKFIYKLNRIKNFVSGRNIVSYDPTLQSSVFIRLKLGLKDEVNKSLYRFVKMCNFDALQKDEFVFYPLQKQPESSVDVIGQYYENQWLNIFNLWRVLPHGVNLVIKEHPNALGDRDVLFYKKIKSLPNVLLISEKIDTRAIIERAICTVSVSGTACYEAALAGKISLTFAPMFFNLLKGCYSLSLNELRECNNFYQLLDHLKDKYCNNQLDPVDFKKLLYSKTFKGEWSPHDNSNLEIENLNNLSDAIWYRHCIGITNINV